MECPNCGREVEPKKNDKALLVFADGHIEEVDEKTVGGLWFIRDERMHSAVTRRFFKAAHAVSAKDSILVYVERPEASE